MAPLVPTRVPGRFLALCDRCLRPTAEEIDAPSVEVARDHLLARGWSEREARAGGGEARWRCPACGAVAEPDKTVAS